MDWAQPRDRLAIRAYIRTQLRSRGLLEFADDDTEAARRADLVYFNCQDQWEEDALEKAPLPLEALQATTTDNAMQSIENTMADNDEFWSSTGSGNGAAGESLLYHLRQPLSHVAYVSIAVYRAHYQHGDPLYPPRKVSFLTGPTPNQLYPASPVYPVRLTDEEQVLALSPTAPISQYLMVRFHGRMQRQWEDLQFYIAIRHVAAYGNVLQPNFYTQVVRAVRSGGLAWPCTRGLTPPAAKGPEETVPFAEGGDALARAQRLHDAGGGGGDGHDAATRCDHVLPPPDVYEVGSSPQPDRGQRRSAVTSSSSLSANTWFTNWWGRKVGTAAGTPAAQPTGAPSQQAGVWASSTSSMAPTKASPLRTEEYTPAGPFTAAAAAAAAAAAGTSAGAMQVPTGPTNGEMQRVVRRAAVTRALLHLNRLRWREVLLVHGAQAEEGQPAPIPAPSPAATNPARMSRDATGVRRLGAAPVSGARDRARRLSEPSEPGPSVTVSAVAPALASSTAAADAAAAAAVAAAAATAAAAAAALCAQDDKADTDRMAAELDGIGDVSMTDAAAAAASAVAETGPADGVAWAGAIAPAAGLVHHLKRSSLRTPSASVKAFFGKFWHRPQGDGAPSGRGGPGGPGGGSGGGGGDRAVACGGHGSCTTAAAAAAGRAALARKAAALAELSYWAAVHPALAANPRVQVVVRRLQYQLAYLDSNAQGLRQPLSPQQAPQQQRCPSQQPQQQPHGKCAAGEGPPHPPPPPQPPRPPALARHALAPGLTGERSRGMGGSSSGGGAAARAGWDSDDGGVGAVAGGSGRHRRAARRALRQAVFHPGRPAFVALEERAAARRQYTMDCTGSGGWLVSHYDHEHL